MLKEVGKAGPTPKIFNLPHRNTVGYVEARNTPGLICCGACMGGPTISKACQDG